MMLQIQVVNPTEQLYCYSSEEYKPVIKKPFIILPILAYKITKMLGNKMPI